MLKRAPTKVVRNHHTDSRQWDPYRPREGDIVIGTAAKVGTTWTQRIVSLLVFQTPEVTEPLLSLSPWVDSRFLMPPEMVIPHIEAQAHRRFLKTHLPMDAIPVYDEVKYIHTARDGRDAAMSYFNHQNSHTAEVWAKFDEIGLADPAIGRPMKRPPKTAAAYFHYWLTEPDQFHADEFFDLEASYWARRREPNVLLVHYNDLKADLNGEMRRISAFLDIPVNESVWPSLVEAATFEGMKRVGDSLLAGMERAFEGGHRSFLHKGTNERWRGNVHEADLELYQEKMRAALTPGLVAWLEGGRRATGEPRTAAD